ncbi:hypothetical protein DGG96_12670 [Legionella qingyii]|uniref:DUF5638 domain-containing protein n=1 Tax=Legionella qingyii TaxID=2184757 RepID=A0A317U256_9GAMM|nr:DUF5638 domain-containing protein [Legionella qingyii]PWY55315.1 hypothetical protein DGG96_12670 [Legionella qingyii]RUR22764.1 hypothetical protein ELY20_08570 [Legionella qingyii]RUR23833.1 hypothetical protein ELY16_12600 [Legionella qingyii]
MPNPLERRLESCRDKLLRLYIENEHETMILQQLTKVDAYYKRSFDKSTYHPQAIVEAYELFVEHLVKVKNGELSAEQALQKIQETTFNRKLGIVFYNIAKALEMAFWAIATPVCLFCATSVTAPNPICGLSLAILFTALMIKSINKFFECIDDFKSCTRLFEEDERERSLVSFFKPDISSTQELRVASSHAQLSVDMTPIYG